MKNLLMRGGIVVGVLLLVGIWAPPVPAGENGGLKMPTAEITIDGKKPARFDHVKHMAFKGVSCGQCHHDAEHQPLTEKKISEMPKGRQLACISCHDDGFKKKELRKKNSIFHARCKECHKTGVDGKPGPAKCNDCHIEKDKK